LGSVIDLIVNGEKRASCDTVAAPATV
jgi:uncharacterized protein YhfF